MILENKVVQQLKLSKKYLNKKCAPKLLLIIEKKKIRNIRMIFESQIVAAKLCKASNHGGLLILKDRVAECIASNPHDFTMYHNRQQRLYSSLPIMAFIRFSEVVYRQYSAHYTPAKARGRRTITVRCSVQGRAYLQFPLDCPMGIFYLVGRFATLFCDGDIFF